MNFNVTKNAILAALGMAGSYIASIFGGWTAAMTTLLILMAVDYFSGWLVAVVFKKSHKTESGGYSSAIGLKGLCKKGMVLLFVLIGYRLDITVGTTYIRDAVCIAFSANELMSIVENAGLMGLPIPAIITNTIDILKEKGDAANG